MNLRLAPGGGQAVRFYPASAGEMTTLPIPTLSRAGEGLVFLFKDLVITLVQFIIA